MPHPIPIESLDLSSRRSTEIEQSNDDQIVVRYFYHRDQFWKAVIPTNNIAAIYGQAFNFSSTKKRKTKDGVEVVYDKRGNPKPKFGIINHVQSRFRLGDGATVRLFALDADINGEPVMELDDFVYSIEAVGPPGMLFNFKNGMFGKLVCAHRFLSTEEMVFERVVVQGYYVRESPPLPLSSEEKSVILRQSLERADEAGLREIYYLYRCCGTNNCTSNPFRIIDKNVKYTFWQKLGSLIYRLPLNPRLYLRVRGLDSDKSHFHLVRSEFQDFIGEAETTKRKRAFVRAEIKKRREAKAAGM